MPEPLGLTTVAIAGIILIGLIFTAINLVKGAGRFIGLGLLAFVLLVLLNRTLSPSGNSTNPGFNSNSSPYSNPNSPYSNPNSSPYSSPGFTSPNSNSNTPNSPIQRSPSSFSFDSISRGISDFAKSVSKGLDRFVYGDPNAVEQPSDQQADRQLTGSESSQAELPSEQQSYQIRPDGVPSRVSTLVVPDSSTGTSGSTSSGSATSRVGAGRPVSAWW